MGVAYTELKERVTVVTGAGSNLGRATALEFAAQGANVIAVDINEESASATCEIARARGQDASHVRADVASAAEVERMLAGVAERYGRMDILINSAGVIQVGRQQLADVEENLFDKVIRVNLKGAWLTMKYSLPYMVARGSGCIVNISSVLGLVGGAGLSVYAASKHGIVGMTKAAALEYGPLGVRINAVCPSRQESGMLKPAAPVSPGDKRPTLPSDRDMNPASGRVGKLNELAATVAFLCSDGAANIHGAAMAIDGGFTAQ